MPSSNAPTVERHVALAGTRIEWHGLAGWLDAVYSINGGYRPAAAFYDKARRLYQSLQIQDIWACPDPSIVSELRDLAGHARYGDAPLRWGLGRAISRPELGTMMVEAENARRRLVSGPRDREAGPRFDPTRIPDNRLDALIQTHKSLDVVEQLRRERSRRQRLRA